MPQPQRSKPRFGVRVERPLRSYLAVMALITLLGLPARSIPDYLPGWYVGYFGDYLWAMLILFILAVATKASTTRAFVLAVSITYAIEISQLFHPPWLERLRGVKVFALVLGFGFLWSDILAYTLGIATGAALDEGLLKRSAARA